MHSRAHEKARKGTLCSFADIAGLTRLLAQYTHRHDTRVYVRILHCHPSANLAYVQQASQGTMTTTLITSWKKLTASGTDVRHLAALPSCVEPTKKEKSAMIDASHHHIYVGQEAGMCSSRETS